MLPYRLLSQKEFVNKLKIDRLFYYIEHSFQVIAIECFEKAKTNKRLLPLNAIKGYKVIYYETTPPIRPAFDRSPTNVRRSVSNAANNNNNTNSSTSPTSSSPTNNQPQIKQASSSMTTASAASLLANQPAKSPVASISETSARAPYRTSEFNFVPRAALTPSAYRRTFLQTESSHSKSQADSMKAADFARMRLGSNGGKKAPNSLTSLELKPATVEGDFIRLVVL